MAQPNYTTLEYPIPAGGSVEIFRQADQLTILEATTPFKVKIDNGPEFGLEAGLSVRFENEFQRVHFINEGETEISVRFGLGKGDVRDSRLTIGNEVGTREAVPATFTALDNLPVAAATNEAAFAADLARIEAGMKNTGDVRVWLRHDAAATAAGMPLDPGESLILNTTAAIFAYNDEGTAAELARWEVA